MGPQGQITHTVPPGDGRIDLTSPFMRFVSDERTVEYDVVIGHLNTTSSTKDKSEKRSPVFPV